MTDREYERRYRISEEEAQRLRSALAFGAPVTVTDVTFGPYGRDSIDRVGWVVRLRSTAGQSRLELKAVLDEPWAWEEIGLGISDPNAAVRMLTYIGLAPGVMLHRNREQCNHGGYRLSLDSVRWLGTFLEVESRTHTDGARTDEVLQELGLEQRPPCDAYGAMLAELLLADATVAHEHDAALRAAVGGRADASTDGDGFSRDRGDAERLSMVSQGKVPSLSDDERQRLSDRAVANRARSFSAYSRFPVGASVLTSRGRYFDGCSVENSSFGLTVCAERAALCAAVLGGVADGDESIVAISVAGPDGMPCPPCGACRQWIMELAPRALVVFPWGSGSVCVPATELVPYAFVYPGLPKSP